MHASQTCAKQQRENNLGVEQFRCVNRQADTYRELVVLEQCAACPVKQLLVPQKKPSKNTSCSSCDEGYLDTYREGWPPCVYREFKRSGEVHCQVTGLPIDKSICEKCDEKAREHTAGLSDKALHYSAAIRKWVASGCPTRTDEEVESIFKDHCSRCDKFDSGANSCKACGCAIGLGKNPLTNKLKMRTESCPLGRF